MISENNNFIQAGYTKRKRRYIAMTLTFAVLVILLSLVMLLYGNTIYSFSTVVDVLKGIETGNAAFTIQTLRLPRLLIGALAGLAFGMAGNTFQTLLRNDLASPDIIGVTSGSSVAAVFCILMLHMSGNAVSLVALISGLLVAALIFLLSQGKGFSKGRLILIGIGIQAMMHAATSFILLKSAEYDVATALRWLNGSLNGVQMKSVPSLFIVVVTVGLFITVLSRHLQVLQLGDASAITLGVKIKLTYLMLIFAAVFLVAFATSVTGPIASVAFLSGPIASKLIGKGRVNTIPAGLVGAILVLAADLVGQYALGTRYPVGVITGILGAPYMLFLLVSMNRKGESV
ncbi:FecCD family ABC transporter permease [Konateibacter massiliensis]|uniref:FecCD family ABC transporter permease n=1 Tax=Konateibacter massiliensis TaxID=2002841 RepID=UPI000C15E4B6|nr:iron ABC transporter permease [Konateibacter massiliensis]